MPVEGGEESQLQLNLCFYCGGVGHLVRSCLVKGGTRLGTRLSTSPALLLPRSYVISSRPHDPQILIQIIFLPLLLSLIRWIFSMGIGKICFPSGNLPPLPVTQFSTLRCCPPATAEQRIQPEKPLYNIKPYAPVYT